MANLLQALASCRTLDSSLRLSMFSYNFTRSSKSYYAPFLSVCFSISSYRSNNLLVASTLVLKCRFERKEGKSELCEIRTSVFLFRDDILVPVDSKLFNLNYDYDWALPFALFLMKQKFLSVVSLLFVDIGAT